MVRFVVLCKRNERYVKFSDGVALYYDHPDKGTLFMAKSEAMITGDEFFGRGRFKVLTLKLVKLEE